MALFEARPQHQHDIGTMALALSGGLISGRRSSSANKAYRLVAEDVLGCAVEGGLLYVDGAGWYRRTRKGDDL